LFARKLSISIPLKSINNKKGNIKMAKETKIKDFRTSAINNLAEKTKIKDFRTSATF
jgi:hypothetical protein